MADFKIGDLIWHDKCGDIACHICDSDEYPLGLVSHAWSDETGKTSVIVKFAELEQAYWSSGIRPGWSTKSITKMNL